MRTRTHTHARTRIHARAHAHTHTHTHTHSHTHTLSLSRTHTQTHTHTNTNTCSHAHVYTNVPMNTRAHTQKSRHHLRCCEMCKARTNIHIPKHLSHAHLFDNNVLHTPLLSCFPPPGPHTHTQHTFSIYICEARTFEGRVCVHVCACL